MIRAIYIVGSLLFTGFLFLIAPFHRKVRDGVKGRLGLKAPRHNNPPIWFHVASSGELEQALSIVDRLKIKNPDIPIHISYFSPTAEKALSLEAKRRFGKKNITWDSSGFSPFDLPFHAATYVERLRPRVLILIHREIWPEMVRAAQDKNVPIYWINVSLPKGYPKFLRVFQDRIKRFQCIATIDENSMKALPTVLKGEVVGDSRVDRVFDRQEFAKLPQPKPRHPIFLLASLWPEDWKAIKEGVFEMLRTYPEYRVWIAPHEISPPFMERIRKDFKHEKLPVGPDENDLITTVGQLAELYALVRFVFVGGSFKKRVHNVLEPAAYSRPILTGPFMQNSVEAKRFWELGGLVASGELEFTSHLLAIAGDEKTQEKMSLALKSYLDKHRGAADRLCEKISAYTAC